MKAIHDGNFLEFFNSFHELLVMLRQSLTNDVSFIFRFFFNYERFSPNTGRYFDPSVIIWKLKKNVFLLALSNTLDSQKYEMTCESFASKSCPS